MAHLIPYGVTAALGFVLGAAAYRFYLRRLASLSVRIRRAQRGR